MSKYVAVAHPVVRELFNVLIISDVYGEIVVDDMVQMSAFVATMSDILDYEQPLQPSLVRAMRPELEALVEKGLTIAQDFLDLTADYPEKDMTFFPTERGDLVLNFEAIDNHRQRRALESR